MIMYSFDEQKTTSQIQEQIHNAPKYYWMLTKMQKSLLNLMYAQMFVFFPANVSSSRIIFLKQLSEGVLYSTANDPQPQMIPTPQMIPKMDRKWSSTESDPQSRPQMIPKEK